MSFLVSVTSRIHVFAEIPIRMRRTQRRLGVLAGILTVTLVSSVFRPSCAGESGVSPIAPQVGTPAPSHNEGEPAAARVRVYLASPLGFAASTRLFMKKRLVPSLTSIGVEIENPWDVPQELKDKIATAGKEKDLDARRTAWREVVQRLGARNGQLIRDAQGVVAVLDGVDVDSGTAAEIGYAAALGKWVIGYRGDTRRTGENEVAEVNLQVEYFILNSGGTIVHSLRDLQGTIRERAKRK